MIVYFSGVLSGSLGTSLSDSRTYIAGASGGCYALIAAHLATLTLNWKEDSAVKIKKVIHSPLTRIVRIIFILFLTVHDIAQAIYTTMILGQESRTGYMGHFCGALAGLLVGIFILDNRRYYLNQSTFLKNHLPYTQWNVSWGFVSMSANDVILQILKFLTFSHMNSVFFQTNWVFRPK